MTMKIVVADDSSTIRGVAESLLRQKGYEVYSAPDGEAAFSLIEKTKPDLIFLDYSMPEPNGISICKRLREISDFKQTPIIIMANARDSEQIVDFVEGGATDTMIKPFTPRELNETVNKFLAIDEDSQIPADASSVQVQHNLVSPGQDSEPESAEMELISTGEEFDEEVLSQFSIESPAGLTDSKELDEVKKRQDDDYDFSWSDLSLDSEEFVNGQSDSKSIDEIIMSEEPEPSLKTDESVSLFMDNYDLDRENERDTPHDYNWFVNEMRKEIKEADDPIQQSEISSEAVSKDTSGIQPESKSEESPGDIKAAEKYEEFISAFRDDIKEIKEQDESLKESPETGPSDEKDTTLNTEKRVVEEQTTIQEEKTQNSLEVASLPEEESKPAALREKEESTPQSIDIPNEVLDDLAGRIASELADKLAKKLSSQLDPATLKHILKENIGNLKNLNRPE